MPNQASLADNQLDYQGLIKKYPWITIKNQNCILSPDSDGFLCGLIMSHYLNWRIVGFYDGKILVLKDGVKCKDCIFLDVDIFKNNIRSIGHHMVLLNKNSVPSNWNNFSNCIQLNNLRNFDMKHDFQRKYPLGTIHFLIGLLDSAKLLKPLPKDAIWPLLFADGVWNNLFGYTENCLDWFNYMNIPSSLHILNTIFCGNESVYQIMKGLDHFLRLRDSFNAKGEYVNGNFISRKTRRTGDKLRITNSNGRPINLIQNNNLFDIHNNERIRVEDFLQQLADHMNVIYKKSNWLWSGFNIFVFSKDNLKAQNLTMTNQNFSNLLQKNPLSWAITSGVDLEYTLEQPDQLP